MLLNQFDISIVINDIFQLSPTLCFIMCFYASQFKLILIVGIFNSVGNDELFM